MFIPHRMCPILLPKITCRHSLRSWDVWVPLAWIHALLFWGSIFLLKMFDTLWAWLRKHFGIDPLLIELCYQSSLSLLPLAHSDTSNSWISSFWLNYEFLSRTWRSIGRSSSLVSFTWYVGNWRGLGFRLGLLIDQISPPRSPNILIQSGDLRSLKSLFLFWHPLSLFSWSHYHQASSKFTEFNGTLASS